MQIETHKQYFHALAHTLGARNSMYKHTIRQNNKDTSKQITTMSSLFPWQQTEMVNPSGTEGWRRIVKGFELVATIRELYITRTPPPFMFAVDCTSSGPRSRWSYEVPWSLGGFLPIEFSEVKKLINLLLMPLCHVVISSSPPHHRSFS